MRRAAQGRGPRLTCRQSGGVWRDDAVSHLFECGRFRWCFVFWGRAGLFAQASEGVEGEGGAVDFLFVGGGDQGGEFVRPVVDGLALVGVGAEIFGVEEQLARERGGAVFKVRHFAEQGAVRIEEARAHGDMPCLVLGARAFADEPARAVDEEVCAVLQRQHFAVDGARAQDSDFYLHHPGYGGAREAQFGVFLRALRQLFIQAGVEIIAQVL